MPDPQHTVAKEQTIASILDIGLVAIVRTDAAEPAIEAAKAIYRGGVRALEVTMTVPVRASSWRGLAT